MGATILGLIERSRAGSSLKTIGNEDRNSKKNASHGHSGLDSIREMFERSAKFRGNAKSLSKTVRRLEGKRRLNTRKLIVTIGISNLSNLKLP